MKKKIIARKPYLAPCAEVCTLRIESPMLGQSPLVGGPTRDRRGRTTFPMLTGLGRTAMGRGKINHRPLITSYIKWITNQEHIEDNEEDTIL